MKVSHHSINVKNSNSKTVRPTKQPKRSFRAFRSVLGVINKLTGLPVAPENGGTAPSFLPVNQAIMVVGALGTDTPDQSGPVRGRIALYDFQNGQSPRFRFVVDVDTKGQPKFNTELLARRVSGSSDMAAVNWALGALCSEATTGLFSIKEGFEAPRNSRTFFSSERSAQSCIQMFDETMSQDFELDPPRFSIPSCTPMIHENRLGAPVDENANRAIMTLSREEFRAHAVNHFMQAVAACSGDARAKLRNEFVFKFISLDRLYCSDGGHSVPRSAAAEIQSWIMRLPGIVDSLHKSANGTDMSVDSKQSLNKACDWLKRYCDSGSATTFRFWMPSVPAGSSNGSFPEVFDHSDSKCVAALPVQISESWEFDGNFPANGADLK